MQTGQRCIQVPKGLFAWHPNRDAPSAFCLGYTLSPCGGMAEMRSAIQVTSKEMKSISAQMYGALRQGYPKVV